MALGTSRIGVVPKISEQLFGLFVELCENPGKIDNLFNPAKSGHPLWDSKNPKTKAIAVSLNTDAIQILKSQQNNHPEFVFTYKGKPVKEANTKAWKEALKRAGIENFRFHDLRHTWASWHVQNGTPLHILQEMVRRYAHLSAEHLNPYSNNVTLKKRSGVTNSLQPEEK